MNIFSLKSRVITLMMAVGLSSLNADAANFNPSGNSRVEKMRQQVKPVRSFRGQKVWGGPTAELNAKMAPRFAQNNKRRTAVDEPYKVFEELSSFDNLEGPDGTTWFYTTEYEIEKIEHSEYWTEEYILGYTFTIYDSSFNEVGKIKDKITLEENETRVASATLDPSASRKFFNSDDNIEVMVYLAMNTSADLGYDVHYYNKVYSIGGEKDAEGNDISIATIPGRCVDVVNAATDSQAEDFYYTFVEDIKPNMDDFDDFLDWVNAVYTHISIYKKATSNEGPTVAYTKDIRQVCYPGDTTDGIYLITKCVDGTPYFIFSQYEKPYFVDPTGWAQDESATEDNSFIIEVYSYTGDMKLLSTTKIPVEIQKVTGEINYAFYSIGSVAWKDDVDMSVNGTTQAPAFLVARDITKASNLEEVVSTYDIYGNDGKFIRTLAENTDGIAVLSAIDGNEPQALFVTISNDGEYVFNFVDLYSGTKVLTLPQNFNGNELTASCNRVPAGNGEYQYVFEMQYDDTDEEGNDIKRMAWVNKDGSLNRIDRVNMGKGIQAASANMFAECLSPTLFDTDDAMEYAVLVKRNSGYTTRTEFIVVDDSGKWYANFTEDEGKGAPYVFTIWPGADGNYLQMVYREDNKSYNIDIYDLPFENSSTTIEGEWEFALNGHYLGSYSLGEFTETFTATLDGNTVMFNSSGSQYNIAAELTAENTLTFKSILVGSSESTYGLWQTPYVNTAGVEDIEQLTEEVFTATYDAEAGTITFPENSGLRYGYFINKTGELSYWDDAFDFVTAKKATGEDNPGTSINAIDAANANADAIFYDLNGRRVNTPKAGLYIMKSGNTVQKVVVE